MPPNKPKNEFPDLDQDAQDEIGAKSRLELRDYIAKVAIDQENLMKARDDDEDLAAAKEAATEAGAVYKEGTKRNRQRTRFAMRCLSDKGGDVHPDGEAPAPDEGVKHAVRRFKESIPKDASVTIATPDGRSVTVKGASGAASP